MSQDNQDQSPRKIVAVVGGAAVGKGVISDYLQEKEGFDTTLSLSNMLRMIATEFGAPHTRDSLDTIANYLRGRYDDQGILAKFAVDAINDHPEWGDVVIESVRHPDEVHALQDELDAFVVGVTMPDDMRLKFLKSRGREGDPTTKKGLNRLKRVEAGLLANGINIPEALEAANVVIHNEGTDINEFIHDTTDILREHGVIGERVRSQTEGQIIQEPEITLPARSRR